jgi:hypothetical protein
MYSMRREIEAVVMAPNGRTKLRLRSRPGASVLDLYGGDLGVSTVRAGTAHESPALHYLRQRHPARTVVVISNLAHHVDMRRQLVQRADNWPSVAVKASRHGTHEVFIPRDVLKIPE